MATVQIEVIIVRPNFHLNISEQFMIHECLKPSFERSVACEQGEGERKGKKKREGKGKPVGKHTILLNWEPLRRRVGIHRYFDCSSCVIYARPSINYSNKCNNNNKTINCVASKETYLELEFRVHCGCMKLGNWYHSQTVYFQL